MNTVHFIRKNFLAGAKTQSLPQQITFASPPKADGSGSSGLGFLFLMYVSIDSCSAQQINKIK